jgi:RNA-directed DNA polymerase
VLVSYADDFVVLCRRGAEEVLEITKQWMEQIGLELNLDKTAVLNAQDEHFDFLGYTFGPIHYAPTGRWYLGAMPSKKAGKRLRRHVREVLRPGNMDPWEEVAGKLNRKLAGWGNYFSYGTTAKTRHRVDYYMQERVRHFLKRRTKLPGKGTRKIPEERVFGELGVLSVQKLPRKSYAHAL